MARPLSFLRRMWNNRKNAATANVPKGMVRTAHGRLIIPFRVSAHGGGISNNIIEFSSQPRARELYAQLQAYVTAAEGDSLTLNEATGRFYLQSDIDRNGIDKATILGEIDIETEKGLFKTVYQRIAISRMFHQAGPGNPVHVDDFGRPVKPRHRR